MAGMGAKVRADRSEVEYRKPREEWWSLRHSESQRETSGHCQDPLGIKDCFLVPQK